MLGRWPAAGWVGAAVAALALLLGPMLASGTEKPPAGLGAAAWLFGVGWEDVGAGVIALLGLAAVGLSLRTTSLVRDATLPVLRWRWSRAAVAFAGAGACGIVVVLARVRSGAATAPDFGLFIAALASLGVAVHLFDEDRIAARFRFDRRDWLTAGLFVVGTGAIASARLTHWTFAWVGDEGAFFELAGRIARGVPANPFDLAGVYGSQPVLDSLYQGLVMRVVGIDVIGWRLAEVLVLALSAGLIFLLGRILAGRTAGLVAATVLGTSHYLIAFAHIGYNNLHCVFWGSLAMLMLALAWRTRRAVFVYATGCVAGLCLYTFQIALFIVPVIAILQAGELLRRSSKRQLAAGLLTLAAFAVTVAPGLLSTTPSKLAGNVYFYSQREAAAARPWRTGLVATARSYAVMWRNPRWHHHHVAGPLLDPVSGLLLAVGLLAAAGHLRHAGERLPLVWFVVGTVAVGLTAYMPYPPLTRLIFVIPPTALLAGVAVAGAAGTLGRRARRGRFLGSLLLAFGLAAILVLNLRQLLVVTPVWLAPPRRARALRVLQDHPQWRVLFVRREAGTGPLGFLDWYSWPAGRYEVTSLDDLPLRLWMVAPGEPLPVVVAYDDDLESRIDERLQGRYQRRPGRAATGGLAAWTPLPGAAARPRTLRRGNLGLSVLRRQLFPVRLRNRPVRGCALDAHGNLYLAMAGAGGVLVFPRGGGPPDELPSRGDGPPPFVDLSGVAVAADGTVFALDSDRSRIVRFGPEGRQLGPPISGLGYEPRGLSLAPGGGLLVAVTGEDLVLRSSRDGSRRSRIGSAGTRAGELRQPTSVVETRGGKLAILDAENQRIQLLGGGATPVAAWSFPCQRPLLECGQLALVGEHHLFAIHPLAGDEGELMVFDLERTPPARSVFPLPAAPSAIGAGGEHRVCMAFSSLNLVLILRIASHPTGNERGGSQKPGALRCSEAP